MLGKYLKGEQLLLDMIRKTCKYSLLLHFDDKLQTDNPSTVFSIVDSR